MLTDIVYVPSIRMSVVDTSSVMVPSGCNANLSRNAPSGLEKPREDYVIHALPVASCIAASVIRTEFAVTVRSNWQSPF